MLLPDEHSGIYTFLVGIVVIVLVAVGLSMLMEKRFAFSSGGLRLEREVASQGEVVVGLRERVDSAAVGLTAVAGPRARAVETLRRTRLKSTAVLKRKADLSAARDGLRAEIGKTEQAFLDYRVGYQRDSRAGAVGEKIGTLTLRDGRSYQDVVITKVTDEGLEIRHPDGFARIRAPDLGADWQDRFHWGR